MNHLDIIEKYFLIILLLLFVIQMIYYWGIFTQLAFYKIKNREKTDVSIPVSVVIAARNEYYRLKRNLPYILEQDYPEFEVIVVNHASEDETKELLKEFSTKYKHLKPINIEEDLNFFKGKKFPLSIGIKSAKYETLLLTDADCKPTSLSWIKKMAFAYNAKTEVLLGYSPYRKEKGLLNLLIRYDTFQVATNYFSFALAGLPYMGVGRNLSYKKSLFLKNKGFISHYNMISGDDDLFISQVAKKRNTTIQLNPESFMISEPKKTFNEWLRQKQRHLTTGKKYKPVVKVLLGLFSLSQWLFYIVIILMLILKIQIIVALSIVVLRSITQLIIHYKIGNKLNDNQIFVFSLFLEPIYMFLAPIFTIKSFFGKTKQWK